MYQTATLNILETYRIFSITIVIFLQIRFASRFEFVPYFKTSYWNYLHYDSRCAGTSEILYFISLHLIKNSSSPSPRDRFCIWPSLSRGYIWQISLERQSLQSDDYFHWHWTPWTSFSGQWKIGFCMILKMYNPQWFLMNALIGSKLLLDMLLPFQTSLKMQSVMNEDEGDFPVAVLSEWLRSLTRNQMGSARTGSNPVDRVLLYFYWVLNPHYFCEVECI